MKDDADGYRKSFRNETPVIGPSTKTLHPHTQQQLFDPLALSVYARALPCGALISNATERSILFAVFL